MLLRMLKEFPVFSYSVIQLINKMIDISKVVEIHGSDVMKIFSCTGTMSAFCIFC